MPEGFKGFAEQQEVNWKWHWVWFIGQYWWGGNDLLERWVEEGNWRGLARDRGGLGGAGVNMRGREEIV